MTAFVSASRAEVPARGEAISKELKAKCQRIIARNREEQPAAAAK